MKLRKALLLAFYFIALIVVVFNNSLDLLNAFSEQGFDVNLVSTILVTIVVVATYTYVNIINKKKLI